MIVGLITLGCDKNTVDNEYLAGMLDRAGCESVFMHGVEMDRPLDAVVVTTCGFIGSAKQQSIQAIMEMAESKRTTGNPGRLFVAGCLAQRYSGELQQEVPEIDGIVGVGQYADLTRMIVEAGEADGVSRVNDVPMVDIYQFMQRRRMESKPHAFLKLSDGCDHACTFCSIPSMKGKLRSVPPEILLKEARGLLDDGVRELNLVAQDLADYGRDRWKDYRLPELLRDLCALDGDFWVRCFYLYPGGINDRLLEVFASEPKIVPYVDMPLQHLDREVLHRMKRPYRDVNTTLLVKRMREAVPRLVLRTTMIVGFPGETPQEHRRMLEGMEELRFDRLGAFMYSQEEGTPAGGMPRQVGKATLQKRWDAVMALQTEIAAELGERRVGETTRVLVEGFDDERGMWEGRSYAEAPEIDGSIYFESDAPVTVGEFVDVEITGAELYDLVGRAVARREVSVAG